MRGQRIGILVFLLALGILACGRKADPRPATLVRPEPITSLAGEAIAGGFRLAWARPEKYLDGQRIDDLGGFLVYRGRPGRQAKEVADLPVADRERFRREQRFDYLDETVKPGEIYYYRVISYTTDGYYSEPSNQVTTPGGS